ncbi:peptidase S8 [Saccharopolyspora spinosa]|uniref:Uncharacterized protein n=1 Tax=Saccharopolyspora spinosa TaxID=60894 RepID=A0A2N3XQC8_SACSN|nr:peptidase S8 [Saccharopolyspora spinosa]PKW12832.1 hypothetical protein A8926_0323 [Saccharopolyspora spinosa]
MRYRTTGIATAVYAREQVTVVVASVGNETAPLCATPAWESGALCVAATDGDELPLHVLQPRPEAEHQGRVGSRLTTTPSPELRWPPRRSQGALLGVQGRDADGIEMALMRTARTPLVGCAGF